MKILFQTQHRDTASTSLLLSHLEFLERLYPVEVMKFASNYCQADVILFMGYDPDFAGVRASGSNAVVGVVDPRGPFDVDLQNADFVIANGIEMRDWCLNVVPQVHVHYLYPVLPESVAGSRSDSPFRVGYHGNRVHIEEMKQRILPALNRLSEQTSVELVLLYNIEQLGRCDSLEDGRSDRVSLQHVQLTTESYSEVLSSVSVGVVPNLLPVTVRSSAEGSSSIDSEGHPHAHESDFLLRFKSSSNPGRIFVFSQLRVPVIADLFPSALHVITPEVDGLVCHSEGAWLNAFQRICKEDGLRDRLADNAFERFGRLYSPEKQSERLYSFLQQLVSR